MIPGLLPVLIAFFVIVLCGLAAFWLLGALMGSAR